MKLYYSPGACSLASHITLLEAGLKYELEKVDLASKKTDQGNNYKAINPKGSVPALKLENGEILTEGAVILQYLADQVPEKNLVPKMGTMERYRTLEMLNYVSTEIHKGFSPLFNPANSDEFKNRCRDILERKFDYLSEKLNKKYLMGDQFSIPDAYLFVCMRWAMAMKFDLTKWPKLMGFVETMKTRPTVQKALSEEGLS